MLMWSKIRKETIEMKKLTALLMTAILCFGSAITAFADEIQTLEASHVAGDYGYNLNGDGSASIVWFNKNRTYAGGDILYIPNVLDGHPVTSLGDRSFSYDIGNKITAVVVPEGVTSIGECAFQGGQYHAVYLPSTLASVGVNAFNQPKTQVRTVVCASANVTLAENTFRNCSQTAFYGPASSTLQTYVAENSYLENCSFNDITVAPAAETEGGSYLVEIDVIGATVTATPDLARAGETVTITVSAEGGFNPSVLAVEADGRTRAAVTSLGNGTFSFVMPASNMFVYVSNNN